MVADVAYQENSPIVVTASLAPQPKAASPASVTIIDADTIARLDAPLVGDYLRLVPSLAVAVSGPAGSLTQVRIRGAEANHTLLLVDGIRANDPAAGNEPRFELLNADLASRIEVVRGPQSALWGSEAIGGVIAVDGAAPGSGGTLAEAEYGSFNSLRGAARTSVGSAERGLSIGLAGQQSDGVDSFSGTGERDGYRNFSGRIAGRYRLSPGLLVGASGFAIAGRSEFDGFDPITFLRADTLDNSRDRLAAGRVFAEVGDRAKAYALVSASLLGSTNRNDVADVPVNRTSAARRTASVEGGVHVAGQLLIAQVETERENFRASDVAYGGFTDQRRRRDHQAVTVEWRGTAGPVSGDVAVRHDFFSAFSGATTLRAGARVAIGAGFAFAGNYGEGFAQPSFFDLFGFFPGSFVGNPALRPERSRGGEVALRYQRGAVEAAVTAYRQRLSDEIVDIFDPTSFLSSTANATGASHRRGVEVEAGWKPSPLAHVSASYSWLDATQPDVAAGAQVKEVRRPRHSGHVAVDGAAGRWRYGAAIAYSGDRLDTNFEVFPAAVVRLPAYWLASARVAYRVSPAITLSLRVANGFDAHYQDVVGYRTEGRSIHAGIRFGLGD